MDRGPSIIGQLGAQRAITARLYRVVEFMSHVGGTRRRRVGYVRLTSSSNEATDVANEELVSYLGTCEVNES